jgi:hypothetical protein
MNSECPFEPSPAFQVRFSLLRWRSEVRVTASPELKLCHLISSCLRQHNRNSGFAEMQCASHGPRPSAMSPLQLWILVTGLATSGTELNACPLAHWEFFRAFGRWPGSRTTTFRIKLRACQGDDTVTVSRHRHVVTQPLCDICKSYLFLA